MIFILLAIAGIWCVHACRRDINQEKLLKEYMEAQSALHVFNHQHSLSGYQHPEIHPLYEEYSKLKEKEVRTCINYFKISPRLIWTEKRQGELITLLKESKSFISEELEDKGYDLIFSRKASRN